MVRVKSNFGGDIRRFQLSKIPTFSLLCEQIRLTYSVKHDVTIKYKDEEGDLVTIASDTDLTEAINGVDGEGVLRIDVMSSIASAPLIPATEARAQGATEQSQDSPSENKTANNAADTSTGNAGAR